MYLQEVRLQNFKRFTDLTIDLGQTDVPYRLVLLIGANGSGKSSVFDAFEICSGVEKDILHAVNNQYYEKQPDNPYQVKLTTTEGRLMRRESSRDDHTASLGSGNIVGKDDFYGRSSLRQVPRLTRTSLGANSFNLEEDSDRPRTYVDRDERFENDLETITRDILRYIYKSDQEKQFIFDRYIQPINEAFARIFAEQEGIAPQLLSIIPPLDGNVSEVQFRKGNAEFHYDLLSNGEKEIFNVLINLLSRSKYYQDTIYFLDEIDLHLNTSLQYHLLQEITEYWLPDNCQLWTASHALGFIDYANDYERAAIVDFNALDFDQPQVLVPAPKDNFEVFEVAVDQRFLAKVFEGKTIFFAENTDTFYYNNLKLENTIFFTAHDKTDVFYKAKNTNYRGLVDRDFLTDEEIALLRQTYPDLFILKYYSLENYLYHPDNLEEYYRQQGQFYDKAKYIQAWKTVRQDQYDRLLLRIQDARQSYPFFRENEHGKKLKTFRGDATAFINLLKSDDFETFYRVLPAKDIGRAIPERVNLDKRLLAQTIWFRQQIQLLLTKDS